MEMQVLFDRIARECRDLVLPLDVADRAVRRAVEVQSDRPPGKRVKRDLVILETFAQVLFPAALDQLDAEQKRKVEEFAHCDKCKSTLS